MLFGSHKRVIYQKNPLEEVIAQLRFPDILLISAQAPVDFQEKLRADYPIYRKRIPSPAALLPAIEHGGIKVEFGGGPPAHEFATDDGNWTVILTQGFLAITTRQYERYEEFVSRLKKAAAALEDVYKPAFYTRIGLRYKDVICRSKLGMNDSPWSELLSPAVAGELADLEFANSVEELAVNMLVKTDVGYIRIQRGLGVVEGNEQEQCYIIDADYYTDLKKERGDAFGTLDRFNGLAGGFFQSCISEKLHSAMAPRPVD